MDAGGHGAPPPSRAVPVPAVLSATGRALEAAGRGAERVQLRPGVCHCPPGALPARGAARSHAGRSCPDPPCPIPRVPQGASPQCHCEGGSREGPAGARSGLAALEGSGMLHWGDVAVLGGFPPAFPQALDGDLYERLREHLSAASRTEVETCWATQDWFQGVVEASARVTAPSPELGGTGGHRGAPRPHATLCCRCAGSRTSSSSCRTTPPSPWRPSSASSSPGWRR